MSRSRTATAGAVLFVLLVPGCDSTAPRGPGAITVSSIAQAPDNFFEYGIAIGKSTPRRAFVGETVLFTQTGLAHGAHEVSLVGVPTNCTGAGARTVNLRGDDTATVAFNITCSRVTGDLRVTVATTGVDLDPNGYLLTANGVIAASLPINGSTTFGFVTPGTYTLGLAGVAANCTASAAQQVTVSAGQLASASFTVTCAAVGVLRFVTSVSGEDRDPDGALVSVDNAPGTRIPLSATTNVRVAAGTRSYALGDVQPNCAITGPATGTHTFAGGDTVTITLAADCTTIPMGEVGTTHSEASVDTLANEDNNPNPAHDVVTVRGRYTPGFLIVVLRFARSVIPATGQHPGALYGFVELDADENVATGFPEPFINGYGGSATQGVDYGLLLHQMDSVSMTLVKVNTAPEPAIIAGRVRARFDTDSVVVFLPLNKLNDDGKLTLTATVGTLDRATDIVPNSGQILLQPPAAPASPLVAARAEHAVIVPANPERIERPKAGTWKPKP